MLPFVICGSDIDMGVLFKPQLESAEIWPTDPMEPEKQDVTEQWLARSPTDCDRAWGSSSEVGDHLHCRCLKVGEMNPILEDRAYCLNTGP